MDDDDQQLFVKQYSNSYTMEINFWYLAAAVIIVIVVLYLFFQQGPHILSSINNRLEQIEIKLGIKSDSEESSNGFVGI